MRIRAENRQLLLYFGVLLLVNLDPHYYSDWCMLFLIGFVGDQLLFIWFVDKHVLRNFDSTVATSIISMNFFY